jgi:hypothetical protein
MLNYLYAVLEAETRLTIAALGLDPGLGLLHIDTPTRDSLACDLMEPIRPSVDAFLIDFLTRSPLKRKWLFEQRDGTCRLMPALAARLGETALKWSAEVAPLAEWFAQAVCSTSPDSTLVGPRSRLTRQRWRDRDGARFGTSFRAPSTKSAKCLANVRSRDLTAPEILQSVCGRCKQRCNCRGCEEGAGRRCQPRGHGATEGIGKETE